MKLQFLGTGTSSGVPAIACDCAVCKSDDLRDKRRRCSVVFTSGQTKLLVDTPPDFRDQALTFDLQHVDAVLITHTHADHIFGMDDLRRYGFVQQTTIPVFGRANTIEELKRFFYYASNDPRDTRAIPRLDFTEIPDPHTIHGLTIYPIDVPHGPGTCTGFVVVESGGESVGYFPDCSGMPKETIARLQTFDLSIMILDALRIKPSPSHLSLEASLALLKEIGAKQSFMTHLSHDLGHQETMDKLPPGIEVAYDGLEVGT